MTKRWTALLLGVGLLTTALAVGCGEERTPSAPEGGSSQAVRVIGDPGGGGDITPAPLCPRPLYGPADVAQVSIVDMMTGLELLFQEYPSVLRGGHAAKSRYLAAAIGALKIGDDFTARQALNALKKEVDRETAANARDVKFWTSVGKRLTLFLDTPSLAERQLDLRSATLGLQPATAQTASDYLNCWSDCMNSHKDAWAAQILECLGLDHGVPGFLYEQAKSCLAGLIAGAILSAPIGGWEGAIAGCLVGFSVNVAWCVGEFLCSFAWQGIKCGWKCA